MVIEQHTNFIIGIIILFIGIPLGNLLAKITKEELQSGKKYFKIITLLSLLGSIISIVLQNDVLLFSFAFIAIVTSRSLNKKDNKNKK